MKTILGRSFLCRSFARRLGVTLACLPIALASTSCNVNEDYFDGEFNAGGADPYNFPPPYRGAGAVRQFAASGVFTEVGAYAKGKPLGYYAFPFSPSHVQTTNYAAPNASAWPDGLVDPLRVAGAGTDFRKSPSNPVPVPLVYSFDGNAKCRAPDGYKYDVYSEAFPRDQQWNIFTFLPDRFTSFPFGGLPTWSYRPIVAEVSVNATAYDCQDAKSERTLLSLADEGKVEMMRADPEPDKTRLGLPNPAKFLAWALIDPGAAVVRVGEEPDVLQGGKVSGTSVQKYGWYGQFIVAYIDGGYIPIEDGPAVSNSPTKRIRPQRLYYPRTPVYGGDPAAAANGAFGKGYDVLQADRFADGAAYSPVCEVWSYALPAPTDIADLPKSEDEIIAAAGSTLEPARTVQPATAFIPLTAVVPRYVFCLQAAPLP